MAEILQSVESFPFIKIVNIAWQYSEQNIKNTLMYCCVSRSAYLQGCTQAFAFSQNVYDTFCIASCSAFQEVLNTFQWRFCILLLSCTMRQVSSVLRDGIFKYTQEDKVQHNLFVRYLPRFLLFPFCYTICIRLLHWRIKFSVNM